MRFLALGPLLLATGDETARPGSPREQVVLATLLLSGDQTVSVDRLVDVVWADTPPASARTQVAISVSALRRTFTAAGVPPDILVTSTPGYRLQLSEDDVDIGVFERGAAQARTAAAEGRPAEAVARLREVLGLWRGRPFDGLNSQFLEAAAVRLEDQRITALEECIGLELALGRHQQVVGELRKLVDEHPHRERLVAHLMVALYRSGRQVEALDVYRMFRVSLAEELGLAPGEELQQLEQAILVQDAALALPEPPVPASPSVVPRQLPSDIGDLTGRTAEITAICAPFEPGPAGSPGSGVVPISLVVGAGGVGKTTLAVHAAHRLREHYPDGQLYADLRGVEPGMSHPAEVLAGFIRALGRDKSSIPDTLAERAALYRSLLSGRRILVLLDSAANERQVEALVPGAASCALVITSRSRLSLAGANVVEVGTLPADDALRLLARTVGAGRVAAEAAAAADLVLLCGGLPLALRIAGSRLAARPHWRLADLAERLSDEHRRLDELSYGTLEVRASLAMSYQSLDEPAQTLFRRLGWLGVPHTAAWVSAALLGVDLATAEEVLDRLVDARLVEAREQDALGWVRYSFHELVRVQAREHALAEDPPQALGAAVERAFGGWLYLAEQAHRRESGGDYTLLHGTAPRWPLAAGLIDRLLADPLRWFDSERRCLRDVVHRAALLDYDEVSWDLAVTSVTLYEAGRYHDDWRQTHERALTTVRRRGNARGEAALLDSLGSLHMVHQRSDEARRLFEPAQRLFAQVGDRHGEALVMRNLAYLERLHGRFDQAMERYQAARRLLRESGDRLGEAHVLGGMAQSFLESGDAGSAERLLTQSLAISQEIGSRRAESQARHGLGELLLRRGEPAAAEDAFRHALELVRRARDEIGQAYTLLGLGEALSRQGKHGPAEDCLRQALQLARDTGEPLIEARTLLAAGQQARLQSRPEVAIAHLERARSLLETLGAPHWHARVLQQLGELYEQTGRAGDADSAQHAAHRTAGRIRRVTGTGMDDRSVDDGFDSR